MERVIGIEPTRSAWKAEVLPLNYTRLQRAAWKHYIKSQVDFSLIFSFYTDKIVRIRLKKPMEFKLDYIIDEILDFISSYITNDDDKKNPKEDEFQVRKKLAHAIENLYASDQALILTKLKENHRSIFLKEFIEVLDEDIILFIEQPLLDSMIEVIGMQKFVYFVAMLEFDKSISVLEHLDEEKRESVMQMLPFKRRIQIKRALSYPENSCGRNMSIDYLSAPYWWTVARTKKYIKDTHHAIENENGIIFITDEERKVIGTLSIIRLVNADGAEIVSNCFEKDVTTVKAYDSIEDVAPLFEQYDLDTIAVTNKVGHIVGILDFSDTVEHLQSQSDKQFLRRAGVFEAKKNTLFGIAYTRFIWLFINLMTATLAPMFISMFEESIAKVTILAVLMPIAASMGGNCGVQTSTVIVRALFVGDVTRKQIATECAVALLNGIALGSICTLVVSLLFSNFTLGAVFGFSIFANLCMAGFFGVLIPIVLKKLKIDPAVASAVFLTTATDVIGFFTFLMLGTIFLV